MGNSKSKSGVTAVRGQIGKKLAFEICAVTGDIKNAADTPKDSVVVRLVLHDETSGNTPPISLENLIRPDLAAGSQVIDFHIDFNNKYLYSGDTCASFGRTSSRCPTRIGRRRSGGWRASRSGSRTWRCRTQTQRSGTRRGSRTATRLKRCSGTAKRLSCATGGRALPPGSTSTSRCSAGSTRESTISCSTWTSRSRSSTCSTRSPPRTRRPTAPAPAASASWRSPRTVTCTSTNRRRLASPFRYSARSFPRASFLLSIDAREVRPELQAKFIPMEEEFSERVQFDLNGKRTKLIDDKSLLEVYPPSAAMASLSDLLKMYSASPTAWFSH